MTWCDVDAVRDHLGGRASVSRKVVYGLVKRGLRVAHIGEPRRDSRGRLRPGRLVFALEWVDEFLTRSADHQAGRRIDPNSPSGAA